MHVSCHQLREMRLLILLAFVLAGTTGLAQTSRVHPLSEFVYVPQTPDKYTWEEVSHIRGRTIFHNSIATTDSAVFCFGGHGGKHSFPGYCMHRVQREMNLLDGKKLRKDSINYPGKGFMRNLFFIRDSSIFIGGGHDSCDTQYAWSDFWRYDLRSHTWQRQKDLPFYYHLPLNVFADSHRTLVLVPKIDERNFQEPAAATIYEYEPAKDSWTPISPPLPFGNELLPADCASKGQHIWPIAFKIEDNIYVLLQSDGGEKNHPGCSSTFYKFSLKTRDWTKLSSFPGWLETFAFAGSDGVYGYIGGGLAFSVAYRKEVYRYDPEREKWERITNLPEGVIYANSWNFKGEMYVGFGKNDRENTITVWRLKHRK